jgi:hypothetical protein
MLGLVAVWLLAQPLPTAFLLVCAWGCLSAGFAGLNENLNSWDHCGDMAVEFAAKLTPGLTVELVTTQMLLPQVIYGSTRCAFLAWARAPPLTRDEVDNQAARQT